MLRGGAVNTGWEGSMARGLSAAAEWPARGRDEWLEGEGSPIITFIVLWEGGRIFSWLSSWSWERPGQKTAQGQGAVSAERLGERLGAAGGAKRRRWLKI
ncbi:hypothetical protein OIU74_003929 [Salix koriyanagi]|uniref:Uncharacterized protein n=1 Tax=Salix koriyanagi TaxID=2511006 RepID=A0A9Q0ZLI8_9ROSI|nr:hypothetical protein OIU74_003929 [Salix koriyanagi]